MNSFSVIIPVKNGGEYLKSCLRSVLSQTYGHFNVLVLESGSTDGSLAWLNAQKDPRVKVFSNPDSLTIEQNWARIKSVPKNEYMTILGQDDLLHPNYLEEMDRLIQKHPDASLYQTHFNYINHSGNLVQPCRPMPEIHFAHEFLAFHMARIIDSTATGYMMRSRDYDMLGGIPLHYPSLLFADHELWINLSLKNYTATSPQFCFSYRLHESVSKLANGKKYQEAFELFIYYLKDLSSRQEPIKLVIEHYGGNMLMYFCEALSHRLLKTRVSTGRLKVSEYIERCKTYAELLVPGQRFEPEKRFRIFLAKVLDMNWLFRSLFLIYKKMS